MMASLTLWNGWDRSTFHVRPRMHLPSRQARQKCKCEASMDVSRTSCAQWSKRTPLLIDCAFLQGLSTVSFYPNRARRRLSRPVPARCIEEPPADWERSYASFGKVHPHRYSSDSPVLRQPTAFPAALSEYPHNVKREALHGMLGGCGFDINQSIE